MSKLLSYLPALISFLTWLFGQFKASQASALAVSGAYSSAADAASNVAFWGNVETGSMIATAVSTAIAWLVNRFWGKVSSGKLQPHVRYQAAMGSKTVLAKYLASDAAALATLDTLTDPLKSVFAAELEAAETPAVEAK